MARQKKSTADLKRHCVKVNFKDAELATIKAVAATVGMDLSNYIRELLLYVAGLNRGTSK